MTEKTERKTSGNGAFHIRSDRRKFFRSMALVSAGFTLPGYLAEALTLSPIVTQGPYYPLASNIPLDKDNDLVQLNDNLTIASGIVTYLRGRILDANGTAVRGALVELWHADREGDYLYSATAARNPACDPNFAGFGQMLTGSTGEFLFRTIKAGLYNGRTRHFHIGVTLPGRTTRSTTQTFWNETAVDLNGNVWATQNSNDMVFQGIIDAVQRASINLTYTPVAGTTTGEVQATWDFVSGFTPIEPTYPSGSLTLAGETVAGPSSTQRYKITIPAYAGYTYEIYGNPTLANLGWQALPFAISATGAIDRNKYTATTDGQTSFYLTQPSAKGFYYVSFRVPGANIGTP
jgi:protocatechuate 3,4-dioxygenase beta subunit